MKYISFVISIIFSSAIALPAAGQHRLKEADIVLQSESLNILVLTGRKPTGDTPENLLNMAITDFSRSAYNEDFKAANPADVLGTPVLN